MHGRAHSTRNVSKIRFIEFRYMLYLYKACQVVLVVCVSQVLSLELYLCSSFRRGRIEGSHISALESYFAVAGGNRTKVCGPCASRAATRASFVRSARHLIVTLLFELSTCM